MASRTFDESIATTLADTLLPTLAVTALVGALLIGVLWFAVAWANGRERDRRWREYGLKVAEERRRRVKIDARVDGIAVALKYTGILTALVAHARYIRGPKRTR